VIYYLVTRAHRYTMADYLTSWGQSLAPTVRVVPYGALPANRALPVGTYVFSDLERLKPAQLSMLEAFRDQLARVGDDVRIVNDPIKSARRLDLLHRLHERGVNRFNAFHPSDPGRPWRYPVFVRQESQHDGSLSGLIRDEASLRELLLILTMEGHDARDLLVVEFCDTADAAGVYRKYSAFRVGDRIFPRHVLFSMSWMQKDLDLLEPAHLEELRAYCRENPHERELLAIFDAADITYGRIDYGLQGGAIQVWEINTNPLIARPPAEYAPFAQKFHQAFATVFNEAFAALDTAGRPGRRIPISWSPERAFGA